MKKSIILSMLLLLILSISSCGVSHAFIFNHNQNATQVHLASNNFTVIDKVRGSEEVSYIMLIGGVNKKQLYANAYANMVNNAKLDGSKALINVLTEEHVGGIPPFFFKRTVTVSAHVIEFNN